MVAWGRRRRRRPVGGRRRRPDALVQRGDDVAARRRPGGRHHSTMTDTDAGLPSVRNLVPGIIRLRRWQGQRLLSSLLQRRNRWSGRGRQHRRVRVDGGRSSRRDGPAAPPAESVGHHRLCGRSGSGWLRKKRCLGMLLVTMPRSPGRVSRGAGDHHVVVQGSGRADAAFGFVSAVQKTQKMLRRIHVDDGTVRGLVLLVFRQVWNRGKII